jgi:hypothetical protein
MGIIRDLDPPIAHFDYGGKALNKFVKPRLMNQDSANFGEGVYRYFQSPIPPTVGRLRRAVYPFAHNSRFVVRRAGCWQWP